jgi:hypothetical protein
MERIPTGFAIRTMRRRGFRRLFGTLAIALMATTAALAQVKPVAAATGEGVGYASTVWCDPMFNTIKVQAAATAAPGLAAQSIQARFVVEKRLSDGGWYAQVIDGSYTTRWQEFVHYRNYNGVMAPTGHSDTLTITMGLNGVYRVWTQYRFYYNGWTAPTVFVPTTAYWVLPYTSTQFTTCTI